MNTVPDVAPVFSLASSSANTIDVYWDRLIDKTVTKGQVVHYRICYQENGKQDQLDDLLVPAVSCPASRIVIAEVPPVEQGFEADEKADQEEEDDCRDHPGNQELLLDGQRDGTAQR